MRVIRTEQRWFALSAFSDPEKSAAEPLAFVETKLGAPSDSFKDLCEAEAVPGCAADYRGWLKPPVLEVWPPLDGNRRLEHAVRDLEFPAFCEWLERELGVAAPDFSDAEEEKWWEQEGFDENPWAEDYRYESNRGYRGNPRNMTEVHRLFRYRDESLLPGVFVTDIDLAVGLALFKPPLRLFATVQGRQPAA